MNRILVTGNAGSGKSTLAKQLAESLDIPLYGLDKIVWQERWQKTPREERQRAIQRITKHKRWIIEGVDFAVMDKADAIVFLDCPRWKCYVRIVKRNWKYLFRSRPELPPRCPEILIIPTLIKIIWQFPKNVKPAILSKRASTDQRFIHVKNQKDIEQLVF